MSDHCSPPELPVSSSAEPAGVSGAGQAVPGAGAPSGIRSIAGVQVAASGQVLGVYAAVQHGLLPPGLGQALLEAQAATGGVVEPARAQLLPVPEALRQGLAGLELKEKLLAAERAVAGYPDPYGGAKLPLFQAIGKEVVDGALGRRWLEAQLATGGLVDPARGVRVAPEAACDLGLLDRETWRSLSAPEPGSLGFHDPNTLERLPYGELLRRCVEAPGSGLALLPLKSTFRSLCGAVSAAELLEAGVLDEGTAQHLQEGRLAVPDVAARAEVRRYLEGTGGVAGVVLLPAGHKKSLFHASAEHLLPAGTALHLLEAQAATGTLVDPATGRRLGVDEAVKAGLVGPELHGPLLLAEQALTGYLDPFSGTHIPLFQAMEKGLVDRPLALRLLDAQLATGGLVCPVRRLRLPLEAALRLGCLDPETQRCLSHARGFLDPSTRESLGFGQLLARCVTDPDTGLAFLPLGEGARESAFIEHGTRQALTAATTAVSAGKFRGRAVPLWELLFSEAVPAERRAALAQQHREGVLSEEELAAQLRAAVEQAEATARVTFAGLRDAVAPGELLESKIIDRDVYERLARGETTARDVGRLDSVRRFLQGTGSVAGLLLPDSQERLGVYEARRRGLLRPGTALVLLEAQAATGFIIDPKENKRYTVEEALRAGAIGPEVYAKLLAAERAVTGYTDPYTGGQVSLFQAMKKELIVREHGIRLLEAQIATGGVIDPVHSHRLPVEVAYQRGYFDEDMSRVLSDPSDDTKGFFDPNTHENLTYLQLLERCVTDPETGLLMLPLGRAQPQLVDGAARQALQGLLLSVRHSRFRGRRVSAWELINSEYFSEERRRQLLRQYQRRELTAEQVVQLLEREAGRWADVTLPALRGRVPLHQLLEAEVIDQGLLDRVLVGEVRPEELLAMDAVRRHLQGTGAVGGVLLQPSSRRLSLYQAMEQKLLDPGTAVALLEAQAATGALLDPCSRDPLSVDEAVRRGLVGPELCSRLRWAEGAVVGFRDPFSGRRVPLFQAMKRGLVPAEQATRLLEAQVATGGVIDPASHLHLPAPVAAQRGCIDRETEAALAGAPQALPSLDGRGRTSYAQLLEQCLRDEDSGLRLLPLPESAPAVPTDEQVQEALRAMPGAEDGTSLWDLVGSCHLTEEQRRGFLEDYRAGRTDAQQLRAAVLERVQGAELLARARVTVPGPRGEVPAVWLLDAGVITQETLAALAQGRRSPGEVAAQPAVKACLWGSGCVAGVLLQPSGAKVSIGQAMQDGLLPAGLGHRLLEAQVACGALIDPMTNRRLSVDSAVQAGLVGGVLREQLWQAERAVSGHVDPYSGGTLSLWQAMEKGLVPRDEGLPLLQAQLSAGGVVDPVHHVHLPLAAACRLGLLDEQTSRALTSTDADAKFFFDPNAREQVTYQQLKERCVPDPASGQWLLPLSQDAVLDVDEHTAAALRALRVPVGAGRLGGQVVSAWELLCSGDLSADKRRELLALCCAGRAAALQQVAHTVSVLVEAADVQPPQATFRGLRKQVSAHDLFRSRLIDKKTLDALSLGKTTVQEVTRMESVRRSLEGANFIAGVLVRATGERMGIPEALRRHLLRPGTALVLLEAQAATGFVIDPVQNQKLTVEEAFSAGMFGKDTYTKLLAAERAVTGYTDPYTGEQISLFQAMKKDLIVREHGVRLLEAQIATGGIIDPVHSHRLPVEVAYQRGYFDEDMSRVLSDPSDDTKGFFDPNTHENLTYLQLLERCVRDPETGLYMLQIVKKGETYAYIDEATRAALRAKTAHMHVGLFAGQTVSVWDLLSSQYFPEERKQELVQQYRAGSLSLESLLAVVTTTVEETEERSRGLWVAGIRGQVTAAELFNSGIIDKNTLDALLREPSEAHALRKRQHVRAYLEGSGCLAGVMVPPGQEAMGLYEASCRGLISTSVAAQLLEAQAATGFVLDPHGQQRLTVDEAVATGLVGEELRERLLNAEKAARGYADPATGATVSLFQAMQQRLVRREDALRFLEVQVATGGVMDPRHGHRLPLDTAYRRGCLDEATYALVSDEKHVNKRFLDPNTQERATYRELQQRGRVVEETGWTLFPLDKEKRGSEDIDGDTRKALEAEWVQISKGRLAGQRQTVWELLNSEYVTEEKKHELVHQYRRDTTQALRQVVETILEMIEAKEKSSKPLWFRGLRRKITASELFQSEIITKKMLEDLERGETTVEAMEKNTAVQRYLEGTGCIAGVLAPVRDEPGRREPLSIYQAMWKGLLRPGTALVLLEAQAATGFVIDPVQNRRLSVEEAVAAGVVGGELRDKLLAAERAVTGYTDPYTGGQVSLFQAMKKELIVREHGVRLLEAQIATGGVIDPVHSHRLPVEVAYQRGYFDEDMSRVLSDPSDDTKGFFDPNTHENLTYLQLLRRCVRDPATGLLMLQLAAADSAVHRLSEELRRGLRDARVTLEAGALRGQSLSVWELLFLGEVGESQRQDVLRRYREGALTAQGVGGALAALLAAGDPQGALRGATMEVRVGRFRGGPVPVWDVLVSGYVPGAAREQLLAQFSSGALSLPALTARLTALVEEAERARGGPGEPGTPEHEPQGHLERDAGPEPEPEAAAARRHQEQALRAATMEVRAGPLQGRPVSVWDILVSSYLSRARRDELLAQHAAGALALPALVATLSRVVEEAEQRLSRVSFPGLRRQVSVSELTTSRVLDAETLRALAQGTKTAQEVTQMASVRRYLEGTGCIAGVLAPVRDVPGRREPLSIYQAMGKGLLRPGTALVLLEAQAATGFVIDPVQNRRLSVEEAVAAGVVGGELRDKLLAAERAVTGYTDPYTGGQVSLFQAMKKELIVREHGIRLLEAQIATGGVIDPVHSHRLPVEVAYQRGYFDEDMSRVLSDPSDDTKGFFDPNTHENLTYLQLLERCVRDPETGLLLLSLSKV
ncbi:LOW QUALITY PROTEIN: epiplakin [Dasypus novemcinctus]|uniref:LOW QUALITY PROTEIN: epiplakin n=1 Tax=Dasypus novemcinctus TaxID=9361 RepID=UPI0026602DEB|nr:LOW QUALITY PROTEIN: epiplakin [Dasypus novemcinctus]